MTKRAAVRAKAEGSYHHGELKNALKRAVLQLVQKKGAKGFSLNEASRLAGVTVGAPYRHFTDKEALLAEVACDGYKLLTEELKAAASHSTHFKEGIVAAGMAYLGFATKHSAYFEVMFQSGLDKTKYPNVEHTGKEAFAVLLGMAQQLETTPELAVDIALSSWALVHGLATLKADGAVPETGSTASRTAYLRRLLERSLEK